HGGARHVEKIFQQKNTFAIVKYSPPLSIGFIARASESITFCELRLNGHSIERPFELKLSLRKV
ncbi:MAG: hypothetical protein WCJ74_03710, partial [bacterium]